MPRNRVHFAAALLRFLLAAFAALLLPLMYPATAAHRPLLGAYALLAAVMQTMIWRGIGGVPRALAMGIVDLALLTFVVHRVGSIGSVLPALYLFVAVINALVVGPRVGLLLSVVASAMYSVLLVLETFAWIPHAPDAPGWFRHARPTGAEALVAGTLISCGLTFCGLVVGKLVERIYRRETDLLEANAQLEALSQRDALTGLFNRRHLHERLEAELARVRRGRTLSVVMIDLDGFKRVNDTHGHIAGDALLQSLAQALAEATRTTDVLGRYGGDEFVMLLPDTTGEAARVAAQRLVDAVRQVGQDFSQKHPVTASVGLTEAEARDDARTAIQRADERAYVAKKLGGDRVAS